MRAFAHRRGMTVIELVVVIALVGIMTGVVIPSVVSLDRRPNGESALDRIQALIRVGRSIAIERAMVVRITIDPAMKRFWLEPPDTTALLSLPDNATLVSTARRVHIRIEPNGETTIDQALFIRDGEKTISVATDR